MTEDEHGWKCVQCFGDKGDADDITDGKILFFFFYTIPFSLGHCMKYSRGMEKNELCFLLCIAFSLLDT